MILTSSISVTTSVRLKAERRSSTMDSKWRNRLRVHRPLDLRLGDVGEPSSQRVQTRTFGVGLKPT